MALIVSVDDPWKGGGVGGKHTHIRLLQKGLQAAGVNAVVVSVRKTASFKWLHLYPGALRRRLMSSKGDRYAHYVKQYEDQLRRNLSKVRLDHDWYNPHDVVAANVLTERLVGMERTSPVILTLHGYFTREAASDSEISESSDHYGRYMATERKACERAWRILCVDTRIRDYVASSFDVEAGRLSVIPNAVDTDAFSLKTDDQRKESRKALGLPSDSFIILCPRRLVAKNGVSYCVKSIPLLSNKGHKVLLLLVGDGPERKAVEGIVKSNRLAGTVFLAGSVPHDRMPAYYAAADAVVIPSVLSAGVEEATSLSMLEGMSSAKPVVVTDVGGLKETVRDHSTGLIVRQADPAAIAGAVEELIKDKQLGARLGTAAREFVVRNHSYTAHAKHVLEEYERATRDGPA